MFGISDNNQNDNPVNTDDQSAADRPQPNFDQPEQRPPEEPPAAAPNDKPAPSGDSLISLKEQALKNLSPLLNHLEQNPEERFKTLMMLIQASDNSNLIPEAYDSANKISDEKERAQALLDVINEINYFTQKDDKHQS